MGLRASLTPSLAANITLPDGMYTLPALTGASFEDQTHASLNDG
jgi:hypothetical protein